MDELRSAGGHARAANDVKALHTISQQLEFVNAKHNNLIQEQREHSRILQQQASATAVTGVSRYVKINEIIIPKTPET